MVLKLWTPRKVDQKYLGSFEMWCCRKGGEGQLDRSVQNEEVLHRVKEERNTLRTVKRRKANRIGHILRRKCLLEYITEGKREGKIEVIGRRGRRHKQLLDGFKEDGGYWKLKEEALDRVVWSTRCGRGCARVVIQSEELLPAS
jgi:hypothetical protein